MSRPCELRLEWPLGTSPCFSGGRGSKCAFRLPLFFPSVIPLPYFLNLTFPLYQLSSFFPTLRLQGARAIRGFLFSFLPYPGGLRSVLCQNSFSTLMEPLPLWVSPFLDPVRLPLSDLQLLVRVPVVPPPKCSRLAANVVRSGLALRSLIHYGTRLHDRKPLGLPASRPPTRHSAFFPPPTSESALESLFFFCRSSDRCFWLTSSVPPSPPFETCLELTAASSFMCPPRLLFHFVGRS